MKEELSMNKSVAKDGTESISYSKRWEKNGLNYHKEIRKVEGGYIITESKYGKPSDGGEDAEYIDERKEYVTTENPFEDKEKDEKEEKMFDFLDMPNLM